MKNYNEEVGDVSKRDLNDLSKKRTKTFIRTRIMGYHRPVSSANIGKRSEFYSRTNFDAKNINTEFCKEFA